MNIVLVLHNIRSLHNVGSVFRTAAAAGAEKIYLTGITPSPLDRFGKIRPQLRKVALGGERVVSWEKISSLTDMMRRLRAQGFTLYAVEQSRKSISYYRARRPKRAAFIFGNEVRGLAPEVLKRADAILEVPLYGKKESLNVSVAAGIVLFRFLYP